MSHILHDCLTCVILQCSADHNYALLNVPLDGCDDLSLFHQFTTCMACSSSDCFIGEMFVDDYLLAGLYFFYIAYSGIQ